MERIRALWAQLTQLYSQLSKREQMLVSLTGVAFIAFVGSIMYATTASAIRRHETSIEEKEMQLQKVAVYAQHYAENERTRHEMEARLNGPPTRLMTKMQELADKNGLTIAGMSEKGDNTTDGVKESLVDVQIREAPIEKLNAMLNEVERDPRIIKIRKLNIRTIGADSKSVNANFTVSTFALAPK